MRVLFIDFLTTEFSSLNDDRVAILNKVTSADVKTEYFGFKDGDFAEGYFFLIKSCLFFKYDRIVLLSSRISHLNIIWPLSIFVKLKAIYHFMPKNRRIYHKVSLIFLQYFIDFGVYSSALSSDLSKFLVKEIKVLPFREIYHKESFELLKKKLSKDQVTMLIPGVRPGVRKHVHLSSVIDGLKLRYNISVSRIIYQGSNDINPYDEFEVEVISRVTSDEYTSLFRESLFVIIDFEESYELRASGVILDALKFGCIVLTTDHPIVEQYGYPNSLVTNLDYLSLVLEQIGKGDLEEVFFGNLKDGGTFGVPWFSFLT